MTTLLIAYDVTQPARLREVARLLEDHGRRIQQSVFVCCLPPPRADALVEEATALIDRETDRLFVLPICGRCREAIEQIGDTEPLPGEHRCYVA
jgi:CRISPR-associated protein Cas2